MSYLLFRDRMIVLRSDLRDAIPCKPSSFAHTHHPLWTRNTANLSSVLICRPPASRDAEDHRSQALEPPAARGPHREEGRHAAPCPPLRLPRPANFSEQGCSGARGRAGDTFGSWTEPRFRGPGSGEPPPPRSGGHLAPAEGSTSQTSAVSGGHRGGWGRRGARARSSARQAAAGSPGSGPDLRRRGREAGAAAPGGRRLRTLTGRHRPAR